METDVRICTNGDVELTMTLPGKEVEIQTTDGPVIIGQQQEYKTMQVIEKDKIPVLIKFLEGNLKGANSELEKCNTTLEQFGTYDCEALAVQIAKMPVNKFSKLRLENINKLAQRVFQVQEAKRNKELIVKNVESMQKQLDLFKVNKKK